MKISEKIDLVNIKLAEIKEICQNNLFDSELESIQQTRNVLLRLYNQAIKKENSLYCEKHGKAFICGGNMLFYCPDCSKEIANFTVIK